MRGRHLFLMCFFASGINSFQMAAASQLMFEYCYGQGCASAPGYEGPMGGVKGPGGVDASEINRRQYEAYRYGKTQELREYKQQVEQQTSQVLNEYKETHSLSEQEFGELKQETFKSLEATYPEVSSDVVSSDIRRQVNPLPEGLSEDTFNNKLDGVWKAVEKGDATQMATEANKLIDSLNPAVTPAPQAQFYKNEMQISGLTRSDGLINLPFAQTLPQGAVQSSSSSVEGQFTRKGLNQLLAAESIVGSACAGGGLSQTLCSDATASIANSMDNYLAFDALAQKLGGMGGDPFLGALLTRLREETAFQFGIVQGIVNGSIGVIDGVTTLASGLYQAVLDPNQAINTLSDIIANADQIVPLIKDAFIKKLDQLQNGTPFEKGQVVGEVAFEVITAMLPFGFASKGAKVTDVALAVESGMVKVIARNAELAAAITPYELRTYLIAQRLKLPAEQIQEFAEFSSRTLLKDESGELAINFARNMDTDKYTLLRQAVDSFDGVKKFEIETYLTNQMANEPRILGGAASYSGEQLRSIGQKYEFFDGVFPQLSQVALPQEGLNVTRVIYKERSLVHGGVTEANLNEAFLHHDGSKWASHRFTGPGQNGLYGSYGENAAETAVKEVAVSNLNDVHIVERYVPLQKTLDLTRPETQQKLGLSPNDLIKPRDELGAYQFTQILGALAEKHGYDSVLFPSAANPPAGKNIVILITNLRGQ